MKPISIDEVLKSKCRIGYCHHKSEALVQIANDEMVGLCREHADMIIRSQIPYLTSEQLEDMCIDLRHV